MNVTRHLRYGIKLMLASALYYSGLMHAYLRLGFRHRGLVLAYHRVLSDTERRETFSSEGILVSPSTFAKHVAFLRRHLQLVGPEELEELVYRRRRFSRPICLITFDDGWRDNLTNAWPILRAHRTPALIFLPTGHIDTGKPFWQERLSRLLSLLIATPSLHAHPVVTRHGLHVLRVTDLDHAMQRACDLAREFKHRPQHEIDVVVDELATLLESAGHTTGAASTDAFMSWDEVQTLSQGGIHFGSHAVTHRILTKIGADEVTTELTESKLAIEQALQKPVAALAYPNGDYSNDTRHLAERAGYRLAFTTRRGWVGPGDDPLTLRRINIHDGATRHRPLFLATILGLF